MILVSGHEGQYFKHVEEEIIINFQFGGLSLCLGKPIIHVKQCLYSCKIMIIFIRKLRSSEHKILSGQLNDFEAQKEECSCLQKIQWQRGDAVSFSRSHI